MAAKGATKARGARCAAGAAGAAGRRGVLSGLAAVVPAVAAQQALAAGPILDARGVKAAGWDYIDEARDGDLTQAERDGSAQARGSLEDTKKRIAESKARIETAVASNIANGEWIQGQAELRRQLGTLRFDLDTVAGKRRSSQELFSAIDELDFAMRMKDRDTANAALEKVKGLF